MIGGVVSGSTREVEKVDASVSGNVAVGGSEDTLITAPVGWIYRVRALRLRALPPAGATGGTHTVFVMVTVGALSFSLLRGESGFAKDVFFSVNSWVKATLGAQPPGAAAQLAAVGQILINDSEPLVIRYTNNTDAIQTNTRELTFLFEKVAV